MRDLSPVQRPKHAARASYDRLSRFYDLLTGSSERPHRERGLALLALQPGEQALEIGFGTGHAVEAMAGQVGPAGRIVGIDLSAGMRGQALQRLQRAGLAERVQLLVGDACQLPLDDAHEDAVFTSFTLELFDGPEIPTVLAECRRVLKPGGRLGVVSMGMTEQPGAMERLYEWAHAHWPVAVDCRPIRALDALTAAGFAVRQHQRGGMWGLPVDVVIAIR